LALSYWIDYLGFITEGKLAAVLITPSLGVPNWSVIYIINTAPSMAAYHEAVFRAIATIREYRAVELAGTTFTAIPHDSLMDEPGMDHDIPVKKKPKLAARLLDRYRKMVGSLYNTHQVLVEDKAEMLNDLTDTTKRRERAQMTR
jgi:hypothetical protein